MSEAEKTTPIAWLCKQCGERVDPTMACCWSCGCDRSGERVVRLEDDLIAVDLDVCPECGYDLRGTSKSRPCPECGFVLPDDEVVTRLYWTPPALSTSAHLLRFRQPLRLFGLGIVACAIGLIVSGIGSVLKLSDAPLPVTLLGGFFAALGSTLVAVGLALGGFALMSWLIHGFSTPGPDTGNIDSYRRGGAALRFFRGPVNWWIAALLAVFILLEALGR